MTSTENAQTWFGLAGGKDGGVRTGAVKRRPSVVASDGAVTGFERCMGGARAEMLVRALDLTGVRLEKVVRLRVAIASGCYRVSAADLAHKMMVGSAAGSRGLD